MKKTSYAAGLLILAILALASSSALAASPNGPPTPLALSWSPAINNGYDFGSIQAGQTASQTFTLSVQTGRVGPVTVTLTGSSAFTKTADSCSGGAITARGSCSVTIQYAPTQPGENDSAQLVATSSHPTHSAGITLTGAAASIRHLYWTNSNDPAANPTSGTIGRAEVTGQNVEQSFITGASSPDGLAVDTSHIYWINSAYPGPSIGRADLDGTNVDQSFIASGSFPNPVAGPGPFLKGLAVDSAHIYWGSSYASCWGCPWSTTIGRANLDGTNVDQSFITIPGVTPTSQLAGVAVDSGHVYWTNPANDTIGRANLDGTNVEPEFITGAPSPYGVAADSAHVYWTNVSPFGGNSVGRADLDGTNVNMNFITGLLIPHGIAVDSGAIYWVNTGPQTIGRANLDGTNANQSFITGGAYSDSITVEAG